MADSSPRTSFLETMQEFNLARSPTSRLFVESEDASWGRSGGFLDEFERRIVGDVEAGGAGARMRLVGSYSSHCSSLEEMSLGSLSSVEVLSLGSLSSVEALAWGSVCSETVELGDSDIVEVGDDVFVGEGE